MELSSNLEFSPKYQAALLFLFPSILILITYLRKKHSFWKSRGVPGPEPKFFIGNVFDNFGKPFFETFFQLFEKYGSVFGFYRGLTPSLICSDLEMIKNICVEDFHIFPKAFSPVYLHSVERMFIIYIYGPRWKRIRSLVSPAFSSVKIKSMFKRIQTCISDRMKELDEISEKGSSFDLKLYWSRYEMDLIARCCFAVSFYAKDDKDPLVRNFIEFIERNFLRILAIITLPEWLIKFFRISFSPAKNLEFLRNLILQVIENRKKASKESSNDFLQLLLDAGGETDGEITHDNDQEADNQNKLTVEEIVGTCMVFSLAGYETTKTLLMWACYRLAINPDIQEKLYREIRATDINNYDKLVSLPYLDAVINETMRIDPPLAMIQRIPQRDYPVPDRNFVVPKHTRIIISIYSIHHDPENYPDPEKFDPDRFLPENRESIKPFSFLPFGAGPRICIGMRFALVNAKLSLATIISRFFLIKTSETIEKLDYRAGTVFLSCDSLKIRLEKRNYSD